MKNAGIYRSVLKITALPAELVPSDGVTGAAQFALYGSVKSAGLSVMPVAKCPLSRPLPPFRDFQRLHCSGIFESPVAKNAVNNKSVEDGKYFF